MKHAVLSPSASHRWLACPGSIEANRDKPYETNKYSLEGTSAHGLLETCLILGDTPEGYKGKVLEPGHFPIDDDMINGVGYALDWVNGYMANNPTAKLLIEYTVFYDRAIGTEARTGFGTADVIIDNTPKEIVAFDYKHGIGITVDVQDNTQLLLYLAGYREEAGKARNYRKVVCQPRARKRKPINEACVNDKQLTDWLVKKVIPIVPIALGENAPRTAGEWCQYCYKDGNCEAQYKTVMDGAAKEFAVSDPKSLSPAQIAKVLNALERITAIGKAVTAHAIELAHAGVEIPGYEKDFSTPRRKWEDDDKANKVLSDLGLTAKERYSVTLITPSEAEKVLTSKGVIPKPKRGEAKPKSPLDKVVTRGEKTPTIAKLV
ncbi:MAG: DUF2800 domain-containing protein [Betaproteobacteria bacterium]